MADKTSRKVTAHDLAAPGPDRIRNVVLVGPTHSGKTSLVEAMLVHAGAITRAGAVTDGTTVCDHEDGERVRGRSVSLAVAPVVHAGVKVNLVDTPGYADFVGEVRAGLRAADCALFVIAANEGVDAATRRLWQECADVSMPRAVVISKLDHARADPEGVLVATQQAFGGPTGAKVLPVCVPTGGGVAPLLGDGADDPRRAELIEAVIEESEDETLMDRYVSGEQIDEKTLVADLEKAIAQAGFFPVVPVCATSGDGVAELLDLCVRAFPSPLEHRAPEVFTPAGGSAGVVTCDPSGPLVAEVVKTASDPYVGRLSLVRVFSGTLDPDMRLHVSGHFASFFDLPDHEDHDEDERIGALAHPFGAHQVLASRVVAGDIATIGRLTRAETGDTLSDPDRPVVLRPWAMPDPLLPIAIEAATRSDEDKLSGALARLAAEDPSLRVQFVAETGQIVLWVVGESHADVALERLRERYGVGIEQREVVIPLRECFGGAAQGHGRNVKQSGGHGQYAVCDITVEPLPEGSGFEFVDKVVGGAVPRQFIPSVEKGVRAQMERGVRAEYPVVDIRVTLVDGKSHSVDSSDMAFQTAGALALRDAAAQTPVLLLEPFDEVAVVVPDELVGTVMSDLSARRGRLLGTDQVTSPTGTQDIVVRAQVPQRDLVRYAIDLRSMTHGAGTFTRTFAHYEPMPEEIAKDVSPRA
ncbi:MULTISPECIES: elongation factor G [Nocardioides]|uniref:Elongation factor G n=1 Tax=Nocardioides vastitatis TaxID=2568655 RepID=A0ABW0ZG85_9ACTN|nr:elongation factor G [Nocardioides sp.]THI91124.1 elongation factor G [Nocardioides sp.]